MFRLACGVWYIYVVSCQTVESDFFLLPGFVVVVHKVFFFLETGKTILHKFLNVYTKSYKDLLKKNETTIQSLQDHGPPG